jgi:hypothetical protein
MPETMEVAEQKSEERWDQMMKILERLGDKVEAMEIGQQRLQRQAEAMEAGQQHLHHQVEAAATSARKAEEERSIMARQVDETGKAVSRLRLEWMAKEIECMETESEREVCNQRRSEGGDREHGEREFRVDDQPGGSRERREQRGGNMGNRVIDPQRGNIDYQPSDLPKMAFPKFQGDELKIWFDKCRRFGPARTVNRPVTLLLRVPA